MNGARAQQVVLVCGVSGVGKTRLIRSFLASGADAATLSAGAIIADARKIQDPEFLRRLPADELLQSQELLIAGFRKLRPSLSQRLLILDVHTLIDNGRELYVIPDAVFSALEPNGIVHVQANPDSIALQRQLDVGRVRPVRSTQELADCQQRSAHRAEQIAEFLGIWSATVLSGDEPTFFKLLARYTDSS